MDKVALILGCGPAGLFAAWAAELAGYEVRIVSKKRRSELFGAQYLHQMLPGLRENFPDLNVESRKVEYKLLGSVDGYRARVYGSTYVESVSVEEYAGVQKVWDIRATYSYLYSFFEDRIMNVVRVDGNSMRQAMRARDWNVDVVFSSIPAPSLCLRPERHSFRSQRIWAIGDAPERGQICPVKCSDETVICNGLDMQSEFDWYRVSRIFGHTTAEWPAWHYPKRGPQAAEVIKPIGHNCTCFPEIRRVGRYGTWTKGVLSHHAFLDAERVFDAAC